MRHTLLIPLTCFSFCYAFNPKEAHHFAWSEAKKEKDAPKSVEGYTSKPAETRHHDHPTHMETQAQSEMRASEIVQTAEQASSIAKQHVFHEQDDHILQAEELFKNPEAYLFGKDCKEELVEKPTSKQVVNKECFELGDMYDAQCSETHEIVEVPGEWVDVEVWSRHVIKNKSNTYLIYDYDDTVVTNPSEEQKEYLTRGIKKKNIIIEKNSPNSGYEWHHGRYGKNYVLIRHGRIQKESTYKIVTHNSCAELENKTNEGHCEYIKAECLDNTPKMFKGKPVSYVKRHELDSECWNKRFVYACRQESSGQPECSELRAQGCTDDQAECHRYIGQVCVEWRKKMRCVNYLRQDGASIKKRYSCGGEPFHCSHGDCESTAYDPNDEMGRAVAELSVLAKAAKSMKKLKVFSGEKKNCKRHTLDFLDCCAGREDGWGQHLGARCGSQAVELAKARKKNLCHRVGTACTNKKPIIGCVTHTTSYCCFPSKLVRIIQEQGRKQLGIGWGSAESPSCRGLTPEELGRIDFSKLDLSELMQDIKATYRKKADELRRGQNATPIQKSLLDKSHMNPRGAEKENNTYLEHAEKGNAG